jgi:signal transduction histidine kinase
MTDQPAVNQKGASNLREKLVQALVALSILVTLSVYVAAAVVAQQTVRRPFLGAFVEPTLVVNSVGDDSWNGRAAGLDLPDHLVALDGQPLTHPEALYEQLSGYKAGDVVTLTVEREDGSRRRVTVTLQSFPSSALIGYFVFPYGIGLAYLLIGLVVFVARRDKAAGRAFALFCVAFALATGLLFDLYTTHRLAPLWVVGLSVLGGSLIHLALVFPLRSRFVRRWPWLSLLVYALSGVIALWALVATTNLEDPWAYILAWRPMYLYTALGALLWVAMLLRRRIRTESPMVREQTRIILFGVLVANLPLMIWFFLASLGLDPGFQPTILFAPLVLLPLSIGYAILRYRLLDVDLLISRSVSYGLLTVLIVGSYALLINLLGLLLGTTIEANNPALVALFVLGVTLAFNPLRTHLHRAVERLFYRDRIDYRQALEAYSRELGRLLDQADIFKALTAGVEAAVHPKRLLFFIYDETAAQFAPVSLRKGPAGGVRFSPDGGLAQLLVTMQESLYLMVGQPLPEELTREAHQLEAVGASLYVPVPKHGWMALGEKRSGEPYSTDDVAYLEALGDQTGLALDRVELISDQERRLRELNALRWVSGAIHFSVELDTLLELIYAQTGKVLDTTNFYIALYDEAKGTLSFAFYVENDERYQMTDEWPLEMGGLHSEVIRQAQPIVTDDYMSECLLRGISPGGKAERAWMGVPLNAGDRVIGVMNVSSSEPGVRYSPDQLSIFTAIAHQAAAIIDKSRLDKEMEERALQLSTLNEVASAINSTLDLDTVLKMITQKAVEILDAESGTLFLTDQETGEHVFQVAVGPSAGELLGLRLAPDKGIVGAAAATQEPILVNDAQQDKRWFSETDESSGYITRALLAVPLISKGQSIGVLEVLNKADGAPFEDQDAQLMQAFASQAAIALENARLFTLTDQALAERVEELSMFQKIDQALNATLDYKHVMELTLDWAMRVTGAEVGSVANLDEERGGLFIVASRGYPTEFEQYREKPWLVSKGIIGRSVTTGKVVVVDDVTADPDYVPAVAESRSQLAVPFCLGDEVIGVISLESPAIGGFSDDDVQFATRLAERAVVPIENAKLFEQVKRANEAKSQFVSMVAHELKNPLTSIGGYARLLELSDGPMDETKKSFTRTITANVDRMRTTVEDLLDISRIERGLLNLEMEEVSMGTVIGETLDSLRNAIDEKGLKLKLAIPEDLPLVWGDRTRLVQVLVNMVDNARKYTLEGSITITAEVVRLPKRDDGHTSRFVRCSVRDTGIGISQEDQERLFKSQFVRFDNGREVAQGYGLGLWLINRLARMQGGEITVASELGKGSAFSLIVPVADGRAPRGR